MSKRVFATAFIVMALLTGTAAVAVMTLSAQPAYSGDSGNNK